MKFVYIIFCLLFLNSVNAQDYSRSPTTNHIELANQLGMSVIWSECAIAALPPNERFNKVVDLDRGVGIGCSLDIEGFRTCLNAFLLATDFADRLYGDFTIVSQIVLGDKDISTVSDEMNAALLADKAYINVSRQYEVNARQKVTISFMCDEKQRNFIMALESDQ